MDVYKIVTDRICEEMKKGIIPWQRPWKGAKMDGTTMAISYTSRRAYSFLNQMLLGEPGEYLTWNEVHKLGGKVNAGEKSRMVVFYSMVKKKATRVNDDGEEEEYTKQYPLLKYYNVFHLNQTSGIKSKIVAGEVVDVEQDVDLRCEGIISHYLSIAEGLKFHNDKPSDRAFYRPSTDEVVVPMLSQYSHKGEYYSTTFHELVHSTMPKDRCDRVVENEGSYFGNHAYSREELVAEMGSAMLCAIGGVETEKTFKNSVAYIHSWIKHLQNDPKMIVWAASRAEKAAAFIAG